MSDLEALLAGLVREPAEETRWLVLADWLEEYDDPRRAELLRLHRRLLATCCEPEGYPERPGWQARVVDLLVSGVVPCVPRETLRLPGGVGMTFAFIPPGTFRMGSEHPEAAKIDWCKETEQPVHRVTLTNGFFMSVHPVTQAQWKAVVGTEPSRFKGPNRPVEQVSWDDCQEFCAQLGKLTGRAVRLPTEAVWEYACRAGMTTEFWFGDVITTDLVNFDGNFQWNGSPRGKYREQTTDVGSFPANPWGLFDLHGNVWEWCQDAWDDVFYAKSPARDPVCIRDRENARVLRGGSWYVYPDHCRAAYRGWFGRDNRDNDIGCRVCFRLD